MGTRRSLRNKEKLVVDEEKEVKDEEETEKVVKDLKIDNVKLKVESDDGSSSDSSVENYLKSAHEINLDSSFFKFEKIENVKPERKRQLSNVDRLSDSDVSESEDETKCKEETVQMEGNSFEGLQNYHKKIEEARLAVEKYKISKTKQEKTDIKKLLSVGETKVSNAVESYMSASSEDEMDWDDIENEKALSQATKQIPKEGVQITVELPTLVRKQKKQDDYMMQMKRRLNRIKKENQVLMHKVHLLCWIAHGNYVNSTLNNENLLGVSLSLIPSENCYPPQRADLKYLEQITRWYSKAIKLSEKVSDKIPTISLEKILQLQFNRKEANSKKNFVLMFICILRALGLQCRLILSLRCLPLRPSASELCSLSTKNNEKASTSTTEKASDKKQSTANTSRSNSKTSKDEKNLINSQKAIKETQKKIPENDKEKCSEDKHRSTSRKVTDNKEEEHNKVDVAEKETKRRGGRKTVENEDKGDKLGKNKTSENKDESDSKKVNSKEKEVKRRSVSKRNDETSEEKLLRPALPTYKENNKNEKEKAKINVKDDSKQLEIKRRSVRKSTGNIEKNDKDKDKSTDKPKETANSRTRRKTTGEINEVKKSPETKKPETKSRSRSSKLDKEKPSTSKDSSKKPEKAKYTSDEEFKPDRRSSLSSPEKLFSPKNDVRNDIINLLKGDMLQQKQKEKQKLVRKKKTVDDESDSDYAPEPEKKPKKSDSGDDFKNKKKNTTKVKQRVKPRSQIDRRVLSTDDEDDSKKEKEKIGNDVWVEVFLEAEEKWISVDVIKGQVHCVSELHSRASTPVTYVIAWNNNLSIKDVTSRYCPHMNTITRKLRIDAVWWKESLKPYIGRKTARDKEEDEDLARQQLDQPLPKTIGEYKNHPLYALKRHLLKFEAIYPPDALTLGFVRNEAVYARECIYTLHSREIWIKHAKVVKPGEQPYKIVKARPKYDKLTGNMITDKPLEIFGIWQVEDYVPPTAENGVVPRNAFGNVELFKPCMLPGGTVHLLLPGLNKVCRKLQIDCAPALVGFDYHSGGSHPTFDGYVVCEEFKDQLITAWEEEQDEIERRELEKIEKRVYDNWRKLIKGLLIREKLKHKYGFDTASGSGIGKKKKKGPRFTAKKRRIVSGSESSS